MFSFYNPRTHCKNRGFFPLSVGEGSYTNSLLSYALFQEVECVHSEHLSCLRNDDFSSNANTIADVSTSQNKYVYVTHVCAHVCNRCTITLARSTLAP